MKTDFLIIGSGLAGLYSALNASRYGKCIIITKGKISDSNTKYAQGGIAAVFGKDDSFESHIKDTIAAGAGLCNKNNVKILVKNGPKEIERLLSYNISFDKAKYSVSIALISVDIFLIEVSIFFLSKAYSCFVKSKLV